MDSGRNQRRELAYVNLTFGMLSIIGVLHPQPPIRAAPEGLGDAHSDIRRDRLVALKDIIKVLA